jgi:hypothetical protein
MTMNFRRSWITLAAGTLAVLALSGCGAGARLYVNRQADMTFYKKVAVLQFSNLCPDMHAGARVTRALVTELSISDRFQLVDPAAVAGELERVGATPDAQGNIDPLKLKDVATRLEVTGFIRGAVTEYGMQRGGTEDFPVVSFDVEMVDAATGNSVWRISVTRKGKGRIPFLGGGMRTFARVTQEACQQAVATLQQKAF